MTSDTKWQSLRIARTAIYYAVLVAFGLASSALGPTLPALAERIHTPLAGMGLLFTARSFGYLVGSFQGGRLYDLVPGHRLMTGLVVLMLLMLIMIPLMPSLWLLFAVVLLLGMAEGSIDVGANTLLVWTHGDQIGPYMNGLHFFWGAGAFIAPIIVTQVTQWAGITWAYWVLALMAAPIIFVLPRIPCPTPNIVPENRTAGGAAGWLIALLAVLAFLYIGTEVTVGGWIYTYALSMGLAEPTSAAYLTSAFWGSLTAGRLLAVPIAAKLRPGTILLVDVLGALASATVMLVWSNSWVVLWGGCIALGLALASVFPTILSFAERHIALTGRLAAWFFVGGSVGGMTVPWLVGHFFESSGPRFTLQAIVVDLLLAVITLVVVMLVSGRMARRSSNRLDP